MLLCRDRLSLPTACHIDLLMPGLGGSLKGHFIRCIDRRISRDSNLLHSGSSGLEEYPAMGIIVYDDGGTVMIHL